jgi:hypothetical protein
MSPVRNLSLLSPNRTSTAVDTKPVSSSSILLSEDIMVGALLASHFRSSFPASLQSNQMSSYLKSMD